MVLGAINGGLGLQLSANTVKGEIAYGVIAGIVFCIYVFVTVLGTFKSRGKAEGETGAAVVRQSEIGMLPLGTKGPETEALDLKGMMDGTSGEMGEGK